MLPWLVSCRRLLHKVSRHSILNCFFNYMKSFACSVAAVALLGAPALAGSKFEPSKASSSSLAAAAAKSAAKSASKSAANASVSNNVSAQNTNTLTSGNASVYDIPETAVAPFAPVVGSGGIGDVEVPLPGLSFGAFYTNEDGWSDRDSVGVSAGFTIPLGAKRFREAAELELASRRASQRVNLIRQALWLQEQGIKLSMANFPEHYEALNYED